MTLRVVTDDRSAVHEDATLPQPSGGRNAGEGGAKTGARVVSGERAKAKRRAHAYFIYEARRWGWDYVLDMMAQAMGHTKPWTGSGDHNFWLYANLIGWPALLREFADLMEDERFKKFQISGGTQCEDAADD